MERPRKQKWTDAQLATLIEMARGGVSMVTIGAELGRSRDAVSSKFQEYCRGLDPASRKEMWAHRDQHLQLPVYSVAGPAQLADRAAREAAGHRSITAAVFGDPLPGRSALDMRTQP